MRNLRLHIRDFVFKGLDILPARMLTGFILAASLFSHSVYAIDLQPGDIVALPPGLNIIQSTYQISKRGDTYANDQKVSS